MRQGAMEGGGVMYRMYDMRQGATEGGAFCCVTPGSYAPAWEPSLEDADA